MGKKEIVFQSESGRIREASSRVLKDLEALGLSESLEFEIKLCIEEAVRNAIVHGNKSDPRKKVRFSYEIDQDAINIEIEDEGAGFNHQAVKDPTKEENILRNSGRGVYLIKKLMDSVEYNQNGNKVKMSKRIK